MDLGSNRGRSGCWARSHQASAGALFFSDAAYASAISSMPTVPDPLSSEPIEDPVAVVGAVVVVMAGNDGLPFLSCGSLPSKPATTPPRAAGQYQNHAVTTSVVKSTPGFHSTQRRKRGHAFPKLGQLPPNEPFSDRGSDQGPPSRMCASITVSRESRGFVQKQVRKGDACHQAGTIAQRWSCNPVFDTRVRTGIHGSCDDACFNPGGVPCDGFRCTLFALPTQPMSET